MDFVLSEPLHGIVEVKGNLEGLPVVFEPPIDTAVLVTETLRLHVLTGGTEPLSYQWYFNDDETTTVTLKGCRGMEGCPGIYLE